MEVGGQIWAPGALQPSPPQQAIIPTTTQPLQLMGMYLCPGTIPSHVHKSKLTPKIHLKYTPFQYHIIYMNLKLNNYLNLMWLCPPRHTPDVCFTPKWPAIYSAFSQPAIEWLNYAAGLLSHNTGTEIHCQTVGEFSSMGTLHPIKTAGPTHPI